MTEKTVLLLGAMKGEISAMVQLSSATLLETWNRLSFYRGKIAEKNVVIGFTGVGKSMSAMVTQRAIEHYNPSHIIFVGLAGALHPDYTIGNIVVAQDCMLHDMDASSLGFERGEIPYTKMRLFPASPDLLSIVQKYKQESVKIGRILTGDLFVSTPYKVKLRQDFAGDAVEMEGASVALVAHYNKIPYLLVRIISDQSDGLAKIDFERFLPQASTKLANFIEFIIQNLG